MKFNINITSEGCSFNEAIEKAKEVMSNESSKVAGCKMENS